MTENNGKEAEGAQPAPNQSGEGSKRETTELIDRALAAAERVEKATATARLEADRWEQMMAKSLLGGRSQAGTPSKTPEQEIDERAKAEVNKYFRH